MIKRKMSTLQRQIAEIACCGWEMITDQQPLCRYLSITSYFDYINILNHHGALFHPFFKINSLQTINSFIVLDSQNGAPGIGAPLGLG